MATLNLMVAWSVAGEDPGVQRGQAGRRVGQHQVLSHAVRPLTLDPTTAAPLTITVQYPPLVAGRLGPCGLLQKCEAEVLVTVHNRMTDMGVDFVFEALTTPSGKRQSANRAAASPSFVWCVPCRAVPCRACCGWMDGCTCTHMAKSLLWPPFQTQTTNQPTHPHRLGCTTRTVKGLRAGASVQLPVRAAFLRPGVYDLNRFRFVVHMAADSAQLVPGVVGTRLRVVNGRVRIPYIFSVRGCVHVLYAKHAGYEWVVS